MEGTCEDWWQGESEVGVFLSLILSLPQVGCFPLLKAIALIRWLPPTATFLRFWQPKPTFASSGLEQH